MNIGGIGSLKFRELVEKRDQLQRENTTLTTELHEYSKLLKENEQLKFENAMFKKAIENLELENVKLKEQIKHLELDISHKIIPTSI